MTVESHAAPPSDAARAAVERLLGALDYQLLGDVYCDEGGPEFWAEHRAAVEQLGVVWARELAARLTSGGSSLYVGAGVAELPALVTETVDLGRRCVAANLRAAECAALNAALSEVGLAGQVQLLPRDATTLLECGPFDHLSLVSVLNDPETFPVVSDVAYGRISPLRLDTAAFDAERAQLRRLVDRLLRALALPAVVTTTYEEVPWLLEAAARLGLAVEADDTVVETAVVGDPIGFLRIGAPQ